VNPWLLGAILVVIVVVAIATKPKRDDAAGDDEAPKRDPRPGMDEGPARSVLDAADDDDEVEGEHDPVPVTAEGLALFPVSRSEIRLLELVRGDEALEMLPPWLRDAVDSGTASFSAVDRLYHDAASRVAGAAHGLSSGDFTGARIKPGVAGSYAYRLETLGRDGDFGFFPFTNKRGAESALRLLETHGIVARPKDEDGEPVAASDEDFEEARRRYEESERELALDLDDEAEGGAPYSDRR
jgi:hypothetical protein